MKFITDENGNTASTAYWGDEQAAMAALKSLAGCNNCINCSDCRDCSRCTSCTSCRDCSCCTDCSHCSDCFSCCGCTDCTGCTGCIACRSSDGNDNESQPLPVPIVPDLHRRVAEAVGRVGDALDMAYWHTCDTIHCRAGWVIHLAGDEGAALESQFGPVLAAMKIYDASCPGYKINPARFYEDDEAAMNDIRKCAE